MPPRPQIMPHGPQQPKKPRFNLGHFLRKLTLEPMLLGDTVPPTPLPLSRSTMTPLKMRPGGVRFLKEIRIMRSFENDARILFEDKIHMNGDILKSLPLYTQEPTKRLLQRTKTHPYHFSSRNDVKRAIHRGPVKDACALARVIGQAPIADLAAHEATASTSERQNRKTYGIEPIFICNSPKNNKGRKFESIKCIVLPVAPWEFSRKDFQDFTITQWPDSDTIKDRIRNNSLTNANLMWAYVHDLCVRHKCVHFVLTSYEMWTFGMFSPFYTLGSVSNVFPWNWCSPFPHCSVLEMFVYWILAPFNWNIPANKWIEADYKDAQEYTYLNETCCLVGDVLDVDPGAVLALCLAS